MTLLHPKVEPTHVDESDAEALIREAKQLRRRRRRRIGSTITLVAALLSGGLYLATDHPSAVAPTRTTATNAHRPFVNLRAFRDEGELAFVSRNTLWVLDGPEQKLREIALPKGLVPQSPTISPDGKWLAFLTGAPQSSTASLWIGTSAGTDIRRITGFVVGDAFGWSPRSDLYAVAAGPLSKGLPDYYQPTTVRLVSPDGSARILTSALVINGGAWSPNGTDFAVSTMNAKSASSLVSYPISGGAPTIWSDGPFGSNIFILPTNWSTSQGIGFTTIGNGAVPDGSGSFSGSNFYVLARPGATPRLLGVTLANDATGAPMTSANGDLAFVNNTGLPRVVWDGKHVLICKPAGSCATVPTPTDDVSEDPAWSSSGKTLAYVVAPSSTNAGTIGLKGGLPGWLQAHRMVLFTPSTGAVRTLNNTAGATDLEWSSSGRDLLYVANNALWLLKDGRGQQVEIAGPLFSAGYPNNAYYGELAWAEQFGWSASTPLTSCYVSCDTGQ